MNEDNTYSNEDIDKINYLSLTFYKYHDKFTKEWIKALRSGKYTQGNTYLKQLQDNDICHCCLGVAIEIQGIEFVPVEDYNHHITTFNGHNSETSHNSSWFEETYGFHYNLNMINDSRNYPTCLIALNDSINYTFDQIADTIENKFIKN